MKTENEMMTKEQENMQQNKKAKGTFIAIMCCACLLGGFLGGFGTWLQRGYDKGEAAAWLGERIGTIAGNGLPVLMVIASAIAFGYMAWALKRSKEEWKQAQNYDDEAFEIWNETSDKRIGTGLNLVSFVTIFNYFSFSVSFYADIYYDEMSSAMFLLALVMLIVTIFASVTQQKNAVDFLKIVNPEKSGSVYDMKFQKKWIESCDEMEQQMIYKAAFHAYKVTNYLCLTLWTGFTVLAVVLKISLWPVTIVSAIWLTMAVSYAAEGKRLSKSKNEAGSAAGGNPLSF